MEDAAVVDTPAQAGNESERERSTIAFPYNDLEDAEKVAAALHQIGGSGQFDQLAAQLKVSPTTGAFRMRLQVAKLFGLITYSQGTASLTPLGARICDPKGVKAARAEAFLTIPLYRRVYDQFKGGTLPPTEGLEAALVGFGVAKKQKDKARQTMQRSASHAGFYWAGLDRLVMPSGTSGTAPAPETSSGDSSHEDEHGKSKRKHRDGGDGGGRHPLIDGLIATLPVEGTEWEIEARRMWLQTAASIFNLIYKTSGRNTALTIEVRGDSAK
jgi:hypothetical protein